MSVCILALVIRHAKWIILQSIVLSPVACPALPYFSTLSHKRHDFRKRSIANKICVPILSTNLSETFLSLRRIQRGIIINVQYIGVRVKYRYSCQMVMKLEFSGQIFEMYWNIKSRENPPHGSRVVPCGRTDMTKLIVAFRNFANATENPLMLFREIIVIGCMSVMEEKWALRQNVVTDFKGSWQLLTLIGSGQSNTFFPLPVVVIGRTITNRPMLLTIIFPPASLQRIRDNSVGIATRYGLEGPGIESRWGEVFRTYLDWLRGPPSLLYNGYRVFPGVKAAGAWCWPRTSF
jgi:hypothetical protein